MRLIKHDLFSQMAASDNYMSMPQFQYDLGYPAKFGDMHLGLYQPVLNRFLLTVCDLEQAQEIIMLASSRYSLYLVDLTQAENYVPNIIDNHCCEMFTMSDPEQINIQLPDRGFMVCSTKKLVAADVVDENFNQEKKYLQLILYYVKFMTFIQWNSRDKIIINPWINNVLDKPMLDPEGDTISAIKKCLYLGIDPDVTELEILYIIKNSPLRHHDFISRSNLYF